MFHMLLDTCVWLDIAKDHSKESLLTVIQELIGMQELTLIVPQTVVDEFNRNKSHVAKDGLKGLTSAINRAQGAIRQLGDPKKRGVVEKYLRDVGYRIPQMGDQALETLATVGRLLNDATVIPTSDSSMLRAGQRGIDKKAPFHRGKNSINDAILVETYREYLAANSRPGNRFVFVTHNKHDFGANDERLPHADIADLFSRVKSLYSINLGETLKRIRPELVTDIMMDAEFEIVPRSLSEISEAQMDFDRKVWYNRHQNWLFHIENEDHKIVSQSDYTGLATTTPRSIFEGARKAAKNLEKKYSKGELGPWDDFEWGMINGKLSALRWVMGDDWDSLDT
jgi:hypothetical protein